MSCADMKIDFSVRGRRVLLERGKGGADSVILYVNPPPPNHSLFPTTTELNMDPQTVIDHTHGRRATDNLRDLKPELSKTPDPEMQPHVQEFEEKILASADEFKNEVRSRRESMADEIVSRRQTPSCVSAHTLHLDSPAFADIFRLLMKTLVLFSSPPPHSAFPSTLTPPPLLPTPPLRPGPAPAHAHTHAHATPAKTPPISPPFRWPFCNNRNYPL